MLVQIPNHLWNIFTFFADYLMYFVFSYTLSLFQRSYIRSWKTLFKRALSELDSRKLLLTCFNEYFVICLLFLFINIDFLANLK